VNYLDLLVWAQVKGFPKGFPNTPSGPSPDDMAAAGTAIFAMMACYGFMLLLGLVALGFAIAGAWKAFAKAGEPGWAVIVPIYNFMILSKIAGKGEGYGALVAVLTAFPCTAPVGMVLFLLLLMEFVKPFGKGAGYAVGLWLLAPIFWPMLGFGSARYEAIPKDTDDMEEEPRRTKRRPVDDDDDEPEERVQRKR
jgi:hypothetical protein